MSDLQYAQADEARLSMVDCLDKICCGHSTLLQKGEDW